MSKWEVPNEEEKAILAAIGRNTTGVAVNREVKHCRHFLEYKTRDEITVYNFREPREKWQIRVYNLREAHRAYREAHGLPERMQQEERA